jgi:hypothetical protein
MDRFTILLLLALSLLLHPGAAAQEMLGVTLGNYAGINSAQLNPSAMHSSKQYLDVELFGADGFIQNNLLYQDKSDYSFGHFFQGGYQFPTHAEDYGTEVRPFYVYNNTHPKDMYHQVRIIGPGAMLIWNRHAFAITTGAREVFSVKNMPYDVANFVYLGLNYAPQHNINYNDTRPFSSAGLAWAEVGVSYAYIIYNKRVDRISVGASVRRLFGVAGTYASVKNINYVVPDDSTLIINNLDAELGVSAPINYSTNQYESGNTIKGGGFGFDVGATYTRLTRSTYTSYTRKPCAARYDDYIFRVGVSLIDIGRIRFKKNAIKYRIDNQSSYWTDVDTFNPRNISNFLDTVSYQFYGDPTTAYVGDMMSVWLPSAASVQFDYHYLGPWYINAVLVYGFNLAKNSVTRPAELAITPRYETGWFEASLPVSLYDWNLVRMGLALRFYILTIGTEKLGQFFSFSDFTGMDLYFNLKIPLDKGSCRARGPAGCPGMEKTPKIKKWKS